MLPAKLVTPIRNFFSPAFELPMRRKLPRFTKPFVNLHVSRSNFIVKTANCHADFLDVLRLRFSVFHKEYMRKKWQPVGFDIESYDSCADHLAVQDLKSGRIIGCYRIISSSWSERFYSESEFELAPFLAISGEKLELSRACIHRRFRSGVVLNLLWRGVVEYIMKTQAKYLFGIPSVTTTDPDVAAKIYHYLQRKNFLSDSLFIEPKPEYQMPGFTEALGLESKQEMTPERDKDIEKLIPALFRVYLKAGAKVCSTPALDRKFRCIDFFTVLETKHVAERFDKKYKIC